MPQLPPRLCRCGLTVAAGAVCLCQRRRKAEREKARPGARQRGYSASWEEASKAFLARPENRRCACGCGRIADMVDHRIAHKGDRRLFWDRANWQPMNRRCNSRKAARREGGFGNPTREARQ
jgi:5-methylcytosine-specific restriction enzyme A